MSIMKINTLNEEAQHIFHSNLVREGAAFAEFGSAFLVDSNLAMHHRNAFDGLWQGCDANIEIQELTDFDLKQELKIQC